MYGKGFLDNMAENLHADCVQSRQAGFMQGFHVLSSTVENRKVCPDKGRLFCAVLSMHIFPQTIA